MDKGRNENKWNWFQENSPAKVNKNAVLKDHLGNSHHPAAQFLEDTPLWLMTPCPESLPNAHASHYALVPN